MTIITTNNMMIITTNNMTIIANNNMMIITGNDRQRFLALLSVNEDIRFIFNGQMIQINSFCK